MVEYDFSNSTDGDLKMRLALGRYLVRKIRSEWSKEPEWADTWQDALKKYENTVSAIVQELRRRRKARRAETGEEKPPAQVVKMRPAVLGAKSKRGGNGKN